MPMELQGFDNLKDDLTNMASNLEFGAGVNRALQEGAKPIEEQMLHNAAEDAGVSLRQIEARQQAPDHPILWNVPETDYLTFYIFQIV